MNGSGAQINGQELFAIIGEKEVALIKLREAATSLIQENQVLRDKVVALEEEKAHDDGESEGDTPDAKKQEETPDADQKQVS